MKKTYQLVTYMMTGLILYSCTSEDPEPLDEPITSSELQFEVGYYEPFENTIYPSMIIGLSQLSDDLTLFNLAITNPKEEPVTALIEIESNDLIEKTNLTFDLLPGVNDFEFKPNWDYSSLVMLDQPGNVNFGYSVSIGGELITTANQTLSYRSIGECVFGFVDEDNEFQDLKFMFAAYVNEDNPKIDNFLAESKAYDIVDSYSGYQKPAEGVLTEIFSLWYALQKKGTQYSSITNTSNPAATLFSQNVRFFDQVLDNSSANCVDGSVFLSSILMKLGIDPVLVLVPGHMYLGFYLSADKEDFYTLETTMIGGVDINDIVSSSDLQVYADNGYFTSDQIEYYNNTCDAGECDVEYMRILISYSLFIDAVNQNSESFNSNIDNFNDEDNHVYQVLDISELREVISPIAR